MGWYDVNVKAPAAGSQMPSVAPGAVLGQGISNTIGGFLERTAKIRAEEAAKQKMAYDMAQEAAAMQLKQQAMEQAKEDSRLDRAFKEAQLKQAKEIADKNFLMDERKLGAEMANKAAYNKMMSDYYKQMGENQRLAQDVEASKAILASQKEAASRSASQAESLSKLRQDTLKQVSQLGNPEDVTEALLKAKAAGPAVERTVLESLIGGGAYNPETRWYELGDWGRRDVDVSAINKMIESLTKDK